MICNLIHLKSSSSANSIVLIVMDYKLQTNPVNVYAPCHVDAYTFKVLRHLIYAPDEPEPV